MTTPLLNSIAPRLWSVCSQRQREGKVKKHRTLPSLVHPSERTSKPSYRRSLKPWEPQKYEAPWPEAGASRQCSIILYWSLPACRQAGTPPTRRDLRGTFRSKGFHAKLGQVFYCQLCLNINGLHPVSQINQTPGAGRHDHPRTDAERLFDPQIGNPLCF